MKRCCVLLSVIILCCALCGCSVNLSPFAPTISKPVETRTFCLYVFGAVEREGYVSLPEGSSVADFVFQAGILPQTLLPSDPTQIVSENWTLLGVGYFENGKKYDCLNVNLFFTVPNFSQDNISQSVVDKIANYVSGRGKITNKQVLADILGQDYQQNYYKFFVSEDDYEKVS